MIPSTHSVRGMWFIDCSCMVQIQLFINCLTLATACTQFQYEECRGGLHGENYHVMDTTVDITRQLLNFVASYTGEVYLWNETGIIMMQ